MLPLLEFAGAKGTYDAKDVLKAKLDVLNKTNMCDFAADVHKEVNGGEPTAEMKAKRAAAIEAHGTLSAAAAKAVKFASDVVAVNQLRRDKAFNVKFANENHGIEARMSKRCSSLPSFSTSAETTSPPPRTSAWCNY